MLIIKFAMKEDPKEDKKSRFPKKSGPRKIYPCEKAIIGQGDNVTTPTTDDKTSRDEDLFLSWHIKLGHAPFKNIQWGATQWHIPKKTC